MTYYRNNIHHLLVLPSLITSIVLHHERISRQDIHYQVGQIYPFLKAELFMRYNSDELHEAVDTLIDELNNQKLICLKEDDIVVLNPRRIRPLQLLAAGVRETCNVMQSHCHYSMRAQKSAVVHWKTKSYPCAAPFCFAWY